jgi:hypothetical protein
VTRVPVMRCCNGCGRELRPAMTNEIARAIEGDPLPDVRAECPDCRPVVLAQGTTAVPVPGVPDRG